jgi:hypothetical protein
MASVTYAYYSQTYGGGLSEAAFGGSVGAAETHVRWLCSVNGICANSTAYKRAVCAACEAFAEFGMGQVGGMSLGDFKISRYADDKGVTGEDMATQAALKELTGTGYAFCGVR